MYILRVYVYTFNLYRTLKLNIINHQAKHIKVSLREPMYFIYCYIYKYECNIKTKYR